MRAIVLALFITALSFAPPLHAQDRYEVSVTRKDRNLYKIDSRPLWIRTRYCYEYVFGEDSVLTAYDIVFLDSGTKCDVKDVLQETSISSGDYKVSVSHEDDDLYSTMDGFFLKTSYCMELAMVEDAVFRSSGYGNGTLHFLDNGKKCDVESVLRKVRL